jgi:hypothetical protein
MHTMNAVNIYLHTTNEEECIMAKVAAISVRVEPDVKAAVEKAAKVDGRTVAQYVERLLVAHLREKGFLKESE